MNIPSLSELKSRITSKVAEKVMDNFGGNPLGEDFSTVTNMFTGFDMDSFNKLSTQEKISKGLVLGGTALGGVGLLGLIGKSSGVDFLSDFSDKTFPVVLGVGALVAVAGLAIPMYEKYKANEAKKELTTNSNLKNDAQGNIQLLDNNGVVIKDENAASITKSDKMTPNFISSKIQAMEQKFSDSDKPRLSSMSMPRPA